MTQTVPNFDAPSPRAIREELLKIRTLAQEGVLISKIEIDSSRRQEIQFHIEGLNPGDIATLTAIGRFCTEGVKSHAFEVHLTGKGNLHLSVRHQNALPFFILFHRHGALRDFELPFFHGTENGGALLSDQLCSGTAYRGQSFTPASQSPARRSYKKLGQGVALGI